MMALALMTFAAVLASKQQRKPLPSDLPPTKCSTCIDLRFLYGEPYCTKCKKRIAANKRRRDRDAMMRDLGLTKVRGATSGKTYWE